MNKNKGFTIIEVIVAISIFSIGVLAIASIQVLSVKQIVSSGKNSSHSFALISEVNRLSLKNYEGEDLAVGKHERVLNSNKIEWEVKGITTRLKSILVRSLDRDGKIVQKIMIYKAK